MKNINFSASLVLSVGMFLLFGVSPSPGQAPVCHSLTAGNLSYSQDFNALAMTGTSSTVPVGFGFVETGTAANTTYGANNGSTSTGNTYSYGSDGSSERAFGGLQSGSLIPTVGGCFTNSTGSTISALQIVYDGEQWRLGALGRLDKLDFQYSLDATSLSTGTWIDVDALDFTAPNTTTAGGILDGNAAGNRTDNITGTISSLTLVNGSTFYIRYNSFDATGSDDGLAVDDFSLAATLLDSTPPTIGYSNLSNTSNTSNRILSATISDNVAVASGALLPKIYFRKNAGTYSSTACSLTSGNAQSGTYDCTIDNSLIGGVMAGDTVGYYVIAQDTSGNIASSPSGVVATNVNTVTTPPTPNNYTILQNFSGSLSIGTGQTITSLTNNGGLFQQMNAGTISGNVTINIASDLTAETGTHALNQLTETGVGGYTVFLQASGAARTISGSSATALITLNGADRVTLSGLAFGPQGLTFRNTGTGATVRIINDSSNNSLISCAVEGGNTNPASGVVTIGSGPTTGNDNNSITDSLIRDRTDATAVPLNLIYNDSSGGGLNSNTTIANNQLVNFTQTGLFNGIVENSTITGNTIFQTDVRNTPIFPLQLVGSSGTTNVSQNIIRDQSTNSAFVGINVQSISGTATISRNRVYNINNSSGNTNAFAGVQLSGNNPAASTNLENNMVAIVPSITTSAPIYGVLDGRTVGSLTMNHNSVFLGESSGSRNESSDVAKFAGTPNSWAFRRITGSTSAVSLTNNILFNNRAPGTENFAVGDDSAGAGSWSSNYNLFVGSGSVAGSFFSINGAAIDFTAWKAGPPTRDANSVASVAGAGPFNVPNMFTSQQDLHLNIAGNNPAVNSGTVTGVSNDFDGQSRQFGSAPDIGADEVQTAPTAAEALIGGRVVTESGRGIRNVRVFVTGGDLTEPRVTITNAFGYFVIDGLRAGETYLVSVGGKRYTFDPPARVVSLGEDALEIDFVGQLR